MNMKVVAPVALSVGLLGIVGGVAATQAFQPVAKPKTQVQLVQPAAQTVTVTPSPATTTATVAPKPVVKTTTVKPAPVQSTQAVAPAPRIVQKAAVVSSDTSTSSSAPAPDPTPATTTAAPMPAGAAPRKGNGSGPAWECGENGCITHTS
jgi:hypothetical protein